MIRTDPIIATLSINDLNQRYAHSFFHYNGKVQKCNGFREDRNGHTTVALELSNGMVMEKFHPDKVNVWRPDAQWLAFQGVPSYFSYRMVRQFCRGFSGENCTTFAPHGQFVPFNQEYLETVFNNPLAKSPKINYGELWDRVNGNAWYILSPSMCVANNGKAFTLYFRSTPVAVLKSRKVLNITQPHFEQEINESVIR